MHRIMLTMLVAIATLISAGRAGAAEGEVNLFVLKRTADGLAIDAIPIAPNQMQVIQLGGDVIDLIFPPGQGQSAAIVNSGDRGMLVARHTGEELRVELRSADGSTRDLRPCAIADLAAYDIRVSVTGHGRRAAFLILQNATVHADGGPASNMFAGRVPEEVLADAYVVQTETYHHDAGAPITGRAPLEIDRWPFVRVTMPDGTEADFIVDIGAAGTVIDRSLLPPDVAIEESSMIEYSAAGKRTLKYEPGGGAGQVQSVIGHAALDRLMVGPVAVAGVSVDVMEKIPDMFGRPVGGILGMDVMRRCPRLTLTLGGDAPSLELGGTEIVAEKAIELPFSFVSTHLAVKGAVNGTPVFFILDTGAPTTFLDEAAADAAGVSGDESDEQDARGLGEGRVRMIPGEIETLTLGDRSFDTVPCRISALSPFDSLRGEDQHAGLLGNDFFSRFSRIEIDFERRVVRFID